MDLKKSWERLSSSRISRPLLCPLMLENTSQNFEELCVNVEYSGFTTIIPASKINNGEYTVGIYIRGGDIEALQYIDKEIVKSKDLVEVTG